MNNKKSANITILIVKQERTRARSVSRHLYDAMLKNNVKLHEVMPVLGEGIVHFLKPLAKNLGFDKDEIVKAFGEKLMKTEFNI